jgi:phenylacetate-CoA ligase
MAEFVQHLRAEGVDGRSLELDVVIATGELLDSATRESLTEFFGCPVVNEYGCSESGIIAFECSHGHFHVIPVAVYVEVAAGSPRVEDVQEGPLLITDLYGDLMPFVRYTLEDIVRLHPPDECACGRELPRLEVLAGRTNSFIRTPDGRQIYGAVLAYSVPSGVSEFQVRQTDLYSLHGQVVVEERRNETEVVEECRRVWSDAVGSEIEIEVEVVDEISRDSSGKRRYLIPLEGANGLDVEGN